MSKIDLRPATKADAPALAIIDNLASHGISLWFWRQNVESGLVEDALCLGCERMADDKAEFAWRNAMVAELNGSVVGGVTSYIMGPFEAEEQFDSKKAEAIFAPLFELFTRCTDSWFIDTLAVFPQARGKGIAKQLLSKSLEMARSQGKIRASLVVEDSNEHALRLYRSQGFSVAYKKPFIEFDGKSETREWLLMFADISQGSN